MQQIALLNDDPWGGNDFGEFIKKGEWEVRDVSHDVARRMVERFHYAQGGSNTATYAHGLFHAGLDIPQGVAWWIPPTKGAAVKTYPENWRGVLALSRLAIAPMVPKNACTFLLARSRKLIDRDKWPCLVTYADEWRGHTGAIYRADNWQYMGLTGEEECFVLDGRMVSRKAGPKTRTREEMKLLGAESVGKFRKHKFVRFN